MFLPRIAIALISLIAGGDDLDAVGSIDQPGAHGVIASPDGQYLYTTNLPGGGANAVFAIDTVTNTIVGDVDGVDSPFPTPHNPYGSCLSQFFPDRATSGRNNRDGWKSLTSVLQP